MSSTSLAELCDLVSNVAIVNAHELQAKFTDILNSIDLDSNVRFLFKTFVFMNWTFVQGVWSNLQNNRLRVDLRTEVFNALILKLAQELTDSESNEEIAANAVFLAEELNSYSRCYISKMEEIGYADAGTARLFCLECIQDAFKIDDSIMTYIVPKLWSNEKLNSEVESVASQVNKTFEEKKGFFRRLFGK